MGCQKLNQLKNEANFFGFDVTIKALVPDARVSFHSLDFLADPILASAKKSGQIYIGLC